VRRLSLALDVLVALREATGSADAALGASATLAELAGADALRLGLREELHPVRESDVRDLRRSARRLELRMAPVPGLVKVALEARPDLVVLAAEGALGVGPFGSTELRTRDSALLGAVRSLEEAGIPVAALVPPEIEAVKAAHTLGVAGVELYTGMTVDLPVNERRRELEFLGDAARLAAKLELEVGVGGGLDVHGLREVLAAAPVCGRVVVGRALLQRAILVGLDRALQDFRALLAA
jgi:pyridoxine 5-phosphate synthase